MQSVPQDYDERVYAGVLGKIIGVYLGRPFEGWSYERLTERFGEISGYVHDQLGQRLIVSDDDISGTFTFLRALADYDYDPALSPAQIGRTWLNYIVENRAILWWGGMGVSSEHTAFLRLKAGISAPESGSIATNGRVVAEQIGAQIFIDGWGLICPGDPERAADYARRAGSVSHDGEAIHGAQAVAALVAAAFDSPGIDQLLDTAYEYVPKDSIIFRLAADIREWAASDRDWRKTRERITGRYGYDKFGGGCHMVPNHALIVLALVYGGGRLGESLKVVNTSGWDTDCNSGNVGCIVGVLGGLAGLDDGGDWRGPVADRMYLPTADGGRGVTDALREAVAIAHAGRRLRGESRPAPKDGARYSFHLPGSVQGFMRRTGRLSVSNPDGAGLRLSGIGTAAAATYVFVEPGSQDVYALLNSPSIYPGQTLRARISRSAGESGPASCSLFIDTAGGRTASATIGVEPGAAHAIEWTVPSLDGMPISDIGLAVDCDFGALTLEWLTWEGAPSAELLRGKAALAAWVSSLSRFEQRGETGAFAVSNAGRGMAITGTREWSDYHFSATLNIHMAKTAGIAARVQGLERYYALLLDRGEALLVKRLDGETVLARAPFERELDRSYALDLNVSGNRITAAIDGARVFDAVDETRPLISGAVALIVDEGNMVARDARVAP